MLAVAPYTEPMVQPRRVKPSVPAPLTVGQALRASNQLVHLGELMAGSRARLECVKAAVPRSLHGALLPGPLDAEGWSLLVRNAAAAAKLRQLKPHLELLLKERYGPEENLRIRVMA